MKISYIHIKYFCRLPNIVKVLMKLNYAQISDEYFTMKFEQKICPTYVSIGLEIKDGE